MFGNDFQLVTDDLNIFVLTHQLQTSLVIIPLHTRIGHQVKQVQFNPLNIVIRDTTADIFNHHLMGFTRQTIDQMGNNLNFWILSQTLDRFHVQFIGMGTVNQVRGFFISSLQAQFYRHMHALR
ncbi:Uncharacterised protein [Streptococcus pneumoniae]|nr:Uncharacterised protein [Streptococcus pneumoniae]